MARKVEVVAHSPRWRGMFGAEAAAVREALGGEAREIHHVGSTAIPGIPAKPIIDILLEARDLERLDGLAPEMNALGYEAWGEYGIPGRRFFARPRKGESFAGRTHHVHAFEAGSPEAERHVAFRDYVAAHPEAAREYGRLKEDLARRFPQDTHAYADGKDAFVKEVERRALAWKRSSG